MSTPPLNSLLDAYRSYTEADRDPVETAVYEQEAEMLRRRDWQGRRLAVGDRVPDIVLPDGVDSGVRLTDLLRDGPLVLKFYRGRWCPYCTLDLRAWQRTLPELAQRQARLVAVSPQGEHEIALTRERDRLSFQIVSDGQNLLARAFGVAYDLSPGLREFMLANGLDATQIDDSGRWTLPLPSCFLIAPDGRIAWQHIDIDYRRRAEPGEVIAALDRLLGR